MNENIRIEKMKSMRTAYFHAFSDTPEDDAWKKAEAWAKGKGLLKKDSKTRIFGRNIYPTTKPKPYGYGYYITITPDIKIEKEIYVRIIPGGLYAISRCEGLEKISKNWGEMWKWVKENKHKYIYNFFKLIVSKILVNNLK